MALKPCPLDASGRYYEHIGPIYEHVVMETKIEIDPKTLAIKEDAEAIEMSTYRDVYSCEACGVQSSNPFHFEDVSDG